MTETALQRVAQAIYEGRNGSGAAAWARLPHAHQAPYLTDATSALRAAKTLLVPENVCMEAFGYADLACSEGASAVEEIRGVFNLILDCALLDWKAPDIFDQVRPGRFISAALSEPTTRERRAEALSDLAALDGETME